MTREEDPPAGQGREGAASMRLCLEANDPSDHIGDGSAAQYAAFDQPGVFIDNPRPTVRPPSGARSRRVRVPPAQWQAVVSGYNLYCQEWSWGGDRNTPSPNSPAGRCLRVHKRPKSRISFFFRSNPQTVYVLVFKRNWTKYGRGVTQNKINLCDVKAIHIQTPPPCWATTLIPFLVAEGRIPRCSAVPVSGNSP